MQATYFAHSDEEQQENIYQSKITQEDIERRRRMFAATQQVIQEQHDIMKENLRKSMSMRQEIVVGEINENSKQSNNNLLQERKDLDNKLQNSLLKGTKLIQNLEDLHRNEFIRGYQDHNHFLDQMYISNNQNILSQVENDYSAILSNTNMNINNMEDNSIAFTEISNIINSDQPYQSQPHSSCKKHNFQFNKIMNDEESEIEVQVLKKSPFKQVITNQQFQKLIQEDQEGDIESKENNFYHKQMKEQHLTGIQPAFKTSLNIQNSSPSMNKASFGQQFTFSKSSVLNTNTNTNSNINFNNNFNNNIINNLRSSVQSQQSEVSIHKVQTEITANFDESQQEIKPQLQQQKFEIYEQQEESKPNSLQQQPAPYQIQIIDEQPEQSISSLRQEVPFSVNEEENKSEIHKSENSLENEDTNINKVPNIQKHMFERHLQYLVGQIESTKDDPVENEKVEELILELHRVSQQNNGVIPTSFQQKVKSLQRDLMYKSSKSPNRSTINIQSTKPDSQDFQIVNLQQYQSNGSTNSSQKLPIYLKDLSNFSPSEGDLIKKEYFQLFENFKGEEKNINIKKIGNFRSLKNPTQSEKNIGLCFLLLFSYLDNQIRLTNDKSTLQDKQWIGNVDKYFNNTGKIMQNIRKLGDIIEYDRVTSQIYKELYALFIGINFYDVCDTAQPFYFLLDAALKLVELIKKLKESQLLGSVDIQQRFKSNKMPSFKSLPSIQVAPYYDQFKHELNTQLFNESEQFDQLLHQKVQQIDETKKTIRDLKGKEKLIKWSLHRKEKKSKQVLLQQDQSERSEYYQDIRKQFLDFVNQRQEDDMKLKKLKSKEDLLQLKLAKLKSSAEYRIQLIEEFKKTLIKLEWNDKFIEQDKLFKQEKHQEFLNNLLVEKAFKKEMMAMQRIIEHQENIKQRQLNTEFAHEKLLKEQAEIMHNIQLLIKFNE